jgi:CRISPR-associated protein Cas1
VCRETTIINERVGEEKHRFKAPILSDRSPAKAKGFVREASGGITMDSETRRTVLVAYQERKQATLTHPVTGESTTYALVPHIQARLLARVIRGDLDRYPAFLVR